MRNVIRHRSIQVVLLAGAAACLGPAQGFAQTARQGGGANAQLMQQLQQLGSERTALQGQIDRLKKDLADVTKERDSLKSSRAAFDERARASEAAIARSARDKETAEAENEKLKERMQELIAKFRETAQTLKDVETDRNTFKQSLIQRDAEIKACTAKNDALYKLNGEILTHMEGQGVFSRLATAEPFTKLKRIQLENLVDDYQYRADDNKVFAAPSPSTPPSSAGTDHP